MRNLIAAPLVLLWAFISPMSARSQAKVEPAELTKVEPAELTKAQPAELMRVTEGVFALTTGKSMDLTNEKLLLSFQTVNSKDGDDLLVVSIGGEPETAQVGSRFNLQHYSKRLASKDECFLDVVDYVVPKGGKPTATFRLSC